MYFLRRSYGNCHMLINIFHISEVNGNFLYLLTITINFRKDVKYYVRGRLCEIFEFLHITAIYHNTQHLVIIKSL